MPKKDVSVIIPVYNEERYILGCLDSLSDQSFKRIEVIIVDDGSSDKTKEIVNKFIKKDKRVRLITGDHKGPGFSRNKGAKYAKGKILVFVDADMTFRKDYIENLISPLIQDKSGKMVGTTHSFEVAKNMDNVWSRCWGEIRTSSPHSRYIEDVVVFRAIRKKYFEKFKGYDPSLGYADDQTFYLKYKVHPYIAKETVCYHRNPETLREVYKQSRWIGASLNNLFFRTPGIAHIVPILLYLISPVAVLALSIKRSIKLRAFSLFFPWMILFIGSRYYGTISGIIRKVYLDKNYR